MYNSNTAKYLKILAAIILMISLSYAYFTVDSVRDIINDQIFGISKIIIEDKPEYQICLIADGTGSTHSSFNIPRIDTAFISKLIDQIQAESSGKVWLTHTDNDSRNNKILYFPIPEKLIHQHEPARKSGETKYAYKKRLEAWDLDKEKYISEATKKAKDYLRSKDAFLVDCEKLLTSKVYISSKKNNWTDINGILNAAYHVLAQTSDDTIKIKKYIVCFSDMKDDAPYLKPRPTLRPTPSGVHLVSVNPILTGEPEISGTINLEHPSRVFETIFQGDMK